MIAILIGTGGRAEADVADAGRDSSVDDLIQVLERATTDEQDLARVDLEELLMRVLATTLWRYRGDGTFDDLEQGLLDAFAGDISGDRGIVGLARNLVDLVDVDDAALGAGDIEVGRLNQMEEDILDILADVAGLGQGSGIGDGEGHVEDASEGRRKQRLARASRADE